MFVSSYNRLSNHASATVQALTPLEVVLALKVRALTLFVAACSTNADNTCSDQLLDLGLDARVLHVLAEGSGVGLSLLQDGLHDGVLHDSHDLVEH